MEQVGDRHRIACEGFALTVRQGAGRWDNPSPCAEWDARGIVEHVIGFHDVLLLDPVGAKPNRPKGDPAARWTVTESAIDAVIGEALAGASSAPKLSRLLPMLTLDVVVHTWDLARSVDIDPHLDPELCQVCLDLVRPNEEILRASSMFGPAVPTPADADPGTRLIALLGRDPDWGP